MKSSQGKITIHVKIDDTLYLELVRRYGRGKLSRVVEDALRLYIREEKPEERPAKPESPGKPRNLLCIYAESERDGAVYCTKRDAMVAITYCRSMCTLRQP